MAFFDVAGGGGGLLFRVHRTNVADDRQCSTSYARWNRQFLVLFCLFFFATGSPTFFS